jgi:hypothetical protein
MCIVRSLVEAPVDASHFLSSLENNLREEGTARHHPPISKNGLTEGKLAGLKELK